MSQYTKNKNNKSRGDLESGSTPRVGATQISLYSEGLSLEEVLAPNPGLQHYLQGYEELLTVDTINLLPMPDLARAPDEPVAFVGRGGGAMLPRTVDETTFQIPNPGGSLTGVFALAGPSNEVRPETASDRSMNDKPMHLMERRVAKLNLRSEELPSPAAPTVTQVAKPNVTEMTEEEEDEIAELFESIAVEAHVNTCKWILTRAEYCTAPIDGLEHPTKSIHWTWTMPLQPGDKSLCRCYQRLIGQRTPHAVMRRTTAAKAEYIIFIWGDQKLPDSEEDSSSSEEQPMDNVRREEAAEQCQEMDVTECQFSSYIPPFTSSMQFPVMSGRLPNITDESCSDGSNCVHVSSTANTALAQTLAKSSSNILGAISRRIRDMPGITAHTGHNQSIVGTNFTSAADNARAAGHQFLTVFSGSLRANHDIDNFDINWTPAIRLAHRTITGDDKFGTKGVPEQRRLQESFLQLLNLPQPVTQALAREVNIQAYLFDTSGLFMMAWLTFFNILFYETHDPHIQPRLVAVDGAQQFWRNYETQQPLELVAQYRDDMLAGRIMIDTRNFHQDEIYILTVISSGFPRWTSDQNGRRCPMQWFRGGAIPIAYYAPGENVRPPAFAITSARVLATIHALMNVYGSHFECVSGYTRAALIMHGRVVYAQLADGRRGRWMTSQLEVGATYHPRPRGFDILWRWLKEDTAFINPLAKLIEPSEVVVVGLQDPGPLWDIAATLAATYTTFSSHVLLYFNIRREELNAWVLRQASNANSVLDELLIPPIESNTYVMLPTICDQIAQWTEMRLNAYLILSSQFGSRTACADVVDAPNSLYRTLEFGVPRIGDLPAISVFLRTLPAEWGIYQQPANWDLKRELRSAGSANNQQGVYLRFGDDRYHQGDSADALCTSQVYVSYGAYAINAIIQNLSALNMRPVLWWEPVGLGLPRDCSPNGVIQNADWQPHYLEHLPMIVPGTLMTYDWAGERTMVPVLRREDMPVGAWDALVAHPVENNLTNVGYNWAAVPTRLPYVAGSAIVAKSIPGAAADKWKAEADPQTAGFAGAPITNPLRVPGRDQAPAAPAVAAPVAPGPADGEAAGN